MDSKKTITPESTPLPPRATPHQDVKSLWERWDKAQLENTHSNLIGGLNLVGLVMIIGGILFQVLGSGVLKLWLAPIIILGGAAILAVKKFRTLWSQRSLNS
jgi:hypothetical protein